MSNICQAGGALFGKKSSFFLKFGQMSKKEEWRNIEKHWLNCPRTSKILTFSQAELLILVIFDVWSLILRWSVIFSKSDLSIFDLWSHQTLWSEVIFDLLIWGVHDLSPFCKSDLLILIFDLQSSELFDLSSQKTGPAKKAGAFPYMMSFVVSLQHLQKSTFQALFPPTSCVSKIFVGVQYRQIVFRFEKFMQKCPL